MTADTTTSGEVAILANLGKTRGPLETRLLRGAVWLALAPFAFTFGINALDVLVLGVPPGELRFYLTSLFDPVFQTWVLSLVIAAWLMRVFFQAVPRVFQQLAQQGVITEKEKGSALAFVQAHDYWLHHPARLLTSLAYMAVGLALDYYLVFGESLARLLPGHELAALGPHANVIWLSNWVNGLLILLTQFFAGNLIFRMFVIATFIYRAPQFFEFHFHPSHPDQCSGFKPIGDLCLKMVYILLVIALHLIFWLLVGGQVTLTPEWQVLVPPYIFSDVFRIPVGILLTILTVSSIAVFFWPMYSVHTLMLAEQAEQHRTLNRIIRHVHALDRSLLQDPTNMPTDDRKKILAEIDSLKELYQHTLKAPTWPFDRNVALKFASTQVLPIISVLGLGGPFNQLAEIVIKLFQGG